MKDDDFRLLKILVDFGLTEAQAKVFITAAQLGTATVNEIAEASDVPFDKSPIHAYLLSN
ncbi:MAG: helix-turn-helix domain-containing protein [Promethearchaeota archaeon]